jgi:hypothetical protein
MKLKRKIKEKKAKPRPLFTDCWNSYWHIIIGVFAVKLKFLVPIFIFYQFIDKTEINVFVDILEFLWGYIAGLLFSFLHSIL